MHKGHRSVLATLASEARRAGRRALAITFHPRPELLLCPNEALPDLTDLDARVAAIHAAGAEGVLVIHFTRHFANLPAPAFLDWLRQTCGVGGLCVGEDFRFGPKAAHDIAAIRSLGMPVRAVPLISGARAQSKASSTHIRQAVAAGLGLPAAIQFA
jgi:riboflavin kinase/FMN adenylyltransferase